MRNLFVGVSALALGMAGAAGAQDGAFYVKGAVGLGALNQPDIAGDDTLDALGVRSFGTSRGGAEQNLRFALGAGYDFEGPWRVDLDLTDRFNQLGAVANITPGNSDYNAVAAMANLYYDFEQFEQIEPYLGVGLGVSSNRYSIQGITGNGVETEDSASAFQAMAGLDFPLTDRVTAGIEYRYFRTEGVDVSLDNGGTAFIDDLVSQDVTVGLKYAFGPAFASGVDDTPEAPMPLAADMDVECTDVPFVVYFAWDSAALTPQARSVIAQAADQASECDITRVTVEGHADTSGEESYNMGLSRRRAAVVRDALVQEGISGGLIRIVAEGESNPAVDTGDGVREPLNRRAEVLIDISE